MKEFQERASQEELTSIEESIVAFAEEAGLRYVKDEQLGFTRKPQGRGFAFLDHNNQRIRCEKTLKRIHGLVIPPAWKSIWICRFANGHLQATGRDARGRKQYRYHADWSRARNDNKFSKLMLFGSLLPSLGESVEKDLQQQGLTRTKVLAAVIKIMEKTHIRVGNDIYAEENDSYGLTTIRNDHAEVSGHQITFEFRGKSGVQHEVALTDPRLSRIIKKCQDLPGEELFAYEDDDGNILDVGSSDVNAYLRSITGESITAKDFRTWGGTVTAIKTLLALGQSPEQSTTAHKKRTCEVIKTTAHALGNTAAVCRKYYVHPSVFEADRDGSLFKLFAQCKRLSSANSKLTAEERVLIKLLKYS